MVSLSTLVRNSVFWAKRIAKFTIPFALALFLLSVWVASDLHSDKADEATGSRLLLHLFVLVVLLVFIFFADALEVAYSLLRYRPLEQFSGTTARVMREMHDDEPLVYEAREWMVTILIVVITLIVDFDHIYLPFRAQEIKFPPIPRLPDIPAGKLFSLLFATIPVLWIAQGPSKRVARERPQKMLELGTFMWWLVKKVGAATEACGLNQPGDLVAGQMLKNEGFGEDSNLKPSDYAYFLASAERYGYTLHDISVQITINKDGSCEVTEGLVYYVICDFYQVFVRKLVFAQPSTGFTSRIEKAFAVDRIKVADPSGKKSKIFEVLDLIARSSYDGVQELARGSVDLTEVPDGHSSLLRHYKVAVRQSPNDSKAMAVHVQFQSTWGAGAFKTPPNTTTDYFFTNFDCPCYRYQLWVDTADDCNFRLAEPSAEAKCGEAPHRGERNRLEEAIRPDITRPNAVHCELLYPFPGTSYYIHWKYRDAFQTGAGAASACIQPDQANGAVESYTAVAQALSPVPIREG